MEKATKIFLGVFGGLVGAAGAFTAGYFVGKKVESKRSYSELEEVRDYYRKKLDNNGIEYDKEEFDVQPEHTDEVEVVIEAPKEAVVTESLSGYSEKKAKEEKTDDYDPDYEEDLDPYIITCDEFGFHPDPEFVASNLYWRGGNDLYDEDGMPVDILSTVGYQALDELKRAPHDDPYVYVRNPRIKVDYEIVRDYLTPGNTGASHANKEW